MNKFNISWVDNHRYLEYNLDYLKDDLFLSTWETAGIEKNQTKIFLHQIPKPYDWMKDVVDQVSNHYRLTHLSFSFHKITPGNFLAMHSDKYGLFRQKFKIDEVNRIQRTIVFLEDADDGHILIVGDTSYINWKKGDSVSWTGEEKHLAANLGLTDRYTLQITGLIND